MVTLGRYAFCVPRHAAFPKPGSSRQPSEVPKDARALRVRYREEGGWLPYRFDRFLVVMLEQS